MTSHFGASPWLALPVGLLLTAVVAYLLGIITLRLSGHYLPLGTIAWGLSLYFLFGNLDWLGKHDGIAGLEPISVFGFSLASGRPNYYLIWLCLLRSMLANSTLLSPRPGPPFRALPSGTGMGRSGERRGG